MKCQLNILMISLFTAFVTSQNPVPSESFFHSAILDAISGNVWLFWNIESPYITFELFGRTSGWVGIGISENGAMIGADIIIGWVSDGNAFLEDRHGSNVNGFPPLDPDQDLTLIEGSEANGWTRIKFRRNIAGCEANYDRTITMSTLRIIWAWGGTDPINNIFANNNYHGTTNRGSRSLVVLESNGRNNMEQEENTDEFTFLQNNFQVPARETYYSCTLFPFPQFDSKRHVIRIEPVITTGNELVVHHILLYQCKGDLESNDSVGRDHECFTDNMPNDYRACPLTIHGWAIGGGTFYFPNHTGFPISESDGPRYVLMEVHYDNPDETAGIIDSSGLRYVYTDQLRQFDAGVMRVGHFVYPLSMLIPPNVKSFLTYGECPAECLAAALNIQNQGSISVFGVLLHSHLLGRAMKLKHISSDGVERPYIAIDDSYDFNYQETKYLQQEVVVSSGDVMQMECNYNSKDRSNMTLAGLGTREEMCLSFVYYYPKIPIFSCESAPNIKQLYKNFKVEDFKYLKSTLRSKLSDVWITSPATIANQTLETLLSTLSWNQSLATQYSNYAKLVDRIYSCQSTVNHISRLVYGKAPNITDRYVAPVPECPASSGEIPQSSIHISSSIQSTVGLRSSQAYRKAPNITDRYVTPVSESPTSSSEIPRFSIYVFCLIGSFAFLRFCK